MIVIGFLESSGIIRNLVFNYRSLIAYEYAASTHF